MEYIWSTLPFCLVLVCILSLPTPHRQVLSLRQCIFWCFTLIAVWLLASVFAIPYTSVTVYTVQVVDPKSSIYSTATATLERRVWLRNLRDRNKAHTDLVMTLRILDANENTIEITSNSNKAQEDILQKMRESEAIARFSSTERERLIIEMDGLMNSLDPVGAPLATRMFSKTPSIDIEIKIESNVWTDTVRNLVMMMMLCVTIGMRWMSHSRNTIKGESVWWKQSN